MPQSLAYRPLLIDNLLSNDRVSSYQAVFAPSNDVELMGVYLWNSQVAGVLYPLVCAAEVTLRNSVDHNLRSHLGTFWWGHTKLKYKSFQPAAPPPRIVTLVRENFAKATATYIREMKYRHGVHGNVVPQHVGVVAKTDFSTWQYVFDHEFTGNSLIWPKHLGGVLSGKWPSPKAATTITHAADLVRTVREFRNRMAHHEPTWKRYGVANETDALAHLHEKIDKIEALLELVHPEARRAMEVNGLLATARRACTAGEIRRMQHLARVRSVRSLAALRRLLSRESPGGDTVAVRVGPRGKPLTFVVT